MLLKSPTITGRIFLSGIIIILYAGISPGQEGTSNIIPPSPTAASLGIMDIIPPNLYTGSISPSVPIANIRSRSLSLDVNLSYSNSGFRPAEAASWVGMGWNLGTGGIITRAMRGLPDDQTGRGYFDNCSLIPSNPYLFTSTWDLRCRLAGGLIDLEPDIFTYSMPGASGRVIFSGSGDEINPFPSPLTNTHIEMIRVNTYIEGFILTSPDGTRYYYGRSADKTRTAVEYTESETVLEGMPSISMYPSAWMLIDIISASMEDTISIYYSSNLLETTGFSYSKTVSVLGAKDFLGDHTCRSIVTRENESITMHYTCKPDSIIGSEGGLVFNHSPGRKDLLEGHLLNSVTQKSRTGKILCNTEFSYSYFGSEDIQGLSRLRLDSLTVSNGSLSKPPYIFLYHDLFPGNYYSNDFDHWGYYNAAGNPELMPAEYPFEIEWFYGAKRDPGNGTSVSGMLKSIKFPTGGETLFEYEPHYYGYTRSSEVYNNNTCYGGANAVANAENLPDGAYEEVLFYVSENQSVDLHVFLADRTGFLEGFVGGVEIYSGSGQVLYQFASGYGADTIYDDIGMPAELIWEYNANIYLQAGVNYRLVAHADMIDNYASATMKWIVPCTGIEEEKNKRLLSGGMRIARITRRDPLDPSKDMVDRYRYIMSDGSRRSSGVLSSGDAIYSHKSFVPQMGTSEFSIGDDGTGVIPVYDGYCMYTVYNGTNMVFNHYTNGSHVGYREVEVIHGADGEFGREIYSFTSPYDYPSQVNRVYPFPPSESYDWKHGLELKRRIIDRKGKLKEMVTNKWYITSGNEQSSMVAGGVKACFLLNTGYESSDSIAVEPYHFETGIVRLDTVTKWRDGVIDSTIYEYDPQRLVRIRESSWDSDGRRRDIRIVYPFQLPGDVYTAMTARNMIDIQVEQKVTVEGKMVSGSLLTWDFFGDNMIKPAAEYQLKVLDNPGYYRPFNGYNTDDYICRLLYEKYDKSGNILQIRRPGDIPVSYIWGYNNTLPVAEVKGISQSETADAIAAQSELISNGTYSARVLYDLLNNNSTMLRILKWDEGAGISEEIGNDGLLTEWRYDDLGRVIKQYDNDGKLRQLFTYHYGEMPLGSRSPANLYLAADRNWVAKYRVKEPDADLRYITMKYTPRISDLEVDYFDGFGRQVQNSRVMGSAWGEDIVTVTSYDRAGRKWRNYLPLPGAFRGRLIDDIEGNLLASSYYSGDIPWSEALFEELPSGRIIEQGEPGANLQPGGGHTTLYNYGTNETEVVSWIYKDSSDDPQVVIFPASSLYRTGITDQNGNRTTEYSDKQGKIVLKISHSEDSDYKTHYIYDLSGRMRMVIPPKANSSPDSVNLIYRYGYDERGRNIIKRIPGQVNPVTMEYDELDRLTGLTDARGIKTWYRYDRFSRMTERGLMKGENEYLLERNWYDNYVISRPSPDGPGFYSSGASNNRGRLIQHEYRAGASDKLLLESYYFDSRGRIDLVKRDNLYGSESATRTEYDFYDRVLAEINLNRYNINGEDYIWQENSYYDYLSNGQLERIRHRVIDEEGGPEEIIMAEYIYDALGRRGTSSFHNNSQSAVYSYNTRGMLTSIDAGDIFKMAICYDDLSGLSDFPGIAGFTPGEAPVEQYNGNISALWWKAPSGNDTVVSAYGFRYDDLNRLTEALYVDKEGITGAFSTGYQYDRAGNIVSLWRNNGINKEEVSLLNDFSYFYKGNLLTGLKRNNEKMYEVWPGDTDNNGLVDVNDLLEWGMVYASLPPEEEQEELLLPRDSISVLWMGHSAVGIGGDSLVYADSDGSGVIDLDDTLAIHLNMGKSHNISGESDLLSRYEYDKSGNMVYDSYRRMRVKYNYMNLPDTLEFIGRGMIVNSYSPGGILLRRVETGISGELLNDFIYDNNFIFRNDTLEYINNPEGYVTHDNGGYSHHYIYSDHLGNTRTITGEDGKAESSYSYYPFGLINNKLSQNYNYPYTYNKKENISTFNLNWLNYGARMYDPEIARWHVMDPASETINSWSPYNYTFNNPIRFVDPDGMVPDEFYFAKNGTDLIEYVETDKPDRVFVAKTEIKSEDIRNLTDPNLYNEVEMSDRQVELRMNSNGYKKVTSEVEVENNQVETRYNMGTTKHSSTISIVNGVEVTTGIDTKYVDINFVEVSRYDTKHSEFEISYNPISNQIATREVYTEKVSYGKKNWINSAIKKFVEFGISMSGSHDQRQKIKINYIE